VGKKILIISIVAAVVVFGGGGLFTAYAMFDVFKSPKAVYLESEYKAWRAFETELSEAVRKWKTEYKLLLEEPYESETEISDLKVKGLENDE
jgi:3-mercaptopyruvate sulfurtransferase SseA